MKIFHIEWTNLCAYKENKANKSLLIMHSILRSRLTCQNTTRGPSGTISRKYQRQYQGQHLGQ